MKEQDLKQKFSEGKKRFILLEFTKELIRNSGEGEIEILKLENILKKQSEEKEIEITENEWTKIVEKTKEPKEELRRSSKSGLSEFSKRFQRAIPFATSEKRSNLPVLRIPRPKLPPRFQYLKPIPTNVEIDLGKLNPLAKDPLVKNIECNGPNQNIIVEGTMGRKKTQIILNRREIDEMIYKFSKTAKIPIYEGVFRVVVGKFIFSAIISEVIGSKFIIRKIVYDSRFR